MEFDLKTLSPEAVPRALAKAERYRLLNEPHEAASICLDALQADPDNQEAITTLLLAITEQFDHETKSIVSDAWHGPRLRTTGEGAASPRGPRLRPTGVRMAARSDDVVREGRRHPPDGQRRPAPSLECVRPADHERRAPRADDGGPRRAAASRINVLCFLLALVLS